MSLVNNDNQNKVITNQQDHIFLYEQGNLDISISALGRSILEGMGFLLNTIKKILVSVVLLATNTLATSLLFTAKATGALILPILILGYISKPLNALNMCLADHAFSPLKNWSDCLYSKNEQMLTVAKSVFSISNGKLRIAGTAWKELLVENRKAILAPVALATNVVTTALFIATKPAYVAFIIPGLFLDTLTLPIFYVNEEISQLTYSHFRNMAQGLTTAQSELLF